MGYIDFMFVLMYLMLVAGMKVELEKKQDQRTYEYFYAHAGFPTNTTLVQLLK